jgi:hypothetical protein
MLLPAFAYLFIKRGIVLGSEVKDRVWVPGAMASASLNVVIL